MNLCYFHHQKSKFCLPCKEVILKIVKELSLSSVLLEIFQGHWCTDTPTPLCSISQLFPGLCWDTKPPSSPRSWALSAAPQVWKSNSANHPHPPPGFPWLPWELSLWGKQETQGTSLKCRVCFFTLNWSSTALPRMLRGSLWVIKLWLLPTRKSCKSRKYYSLGLSFLWVYKNQPF